MKSILYILFFVLYSSVGAVPANKPDQSQKSQSTGTVEFVFIPMVDNKPLYLDSVYVSPAGEKYSLKSLKFFLSNIALARSIGVETTAHTETPTGVYLIDFSESNFDAGYGNQSVKISFKSPPGQYTDIRFDIGVPRQLNHSDPTTAQFPLDLGRGDMYWDWNSGYIFLLAEGKGTDLYKNSFHIAIGDDSRILPLKFGNLFDVVPKVIVEEGKTIQVKFILDFNKFLINGDASKYSFKTFESSNVHGGLNADILRLNVLKAFDFMSIE